MRSVLLLCMVMAGATSLFGSAAGWGVETPSATLTLATTTSTQDSGLLDVLLPPFEKANGVKIKVLAVGTGQALEVARRGDADVCVTHAPQLEEQFVKEGHGLARRPFMYNDFVVVGPTGDPAGIGKARSAQQAFQFIAKAGKTFVSRGDGSGTHVKELAIWAKAGIKPAGDWYLEGGSGMAATLRLADERSAYTLSDRATYLAQEGKPATPSAGKLSLTILYQGDATLRNVYSVIVVSPKKHPGTNAIMAGRFAEYLFSPQARQLIGSFGKDKYGERLFTPLKPEKSKVKRRG
jgi:tungstate transport system substrate-binding protein